MEILPQLLINSLIAGSIYALASSGLSLSYGLLKLLNFAHGHYMMVGVYMFYFFGTTLALGLPLATLLTLLFSILLAVSTLKIFILPFARYNMLLSLVSTLALSIIFESLISIYFGVNVKSLSVGIATESFQFGSIYITQIQILIVMSALFLLSGLAILVHSTAFGRTIRAFSENPFAAEAIGISKNKLCYLVFCLSVLLCSYAGILVGFETNMQPTMGSAYTIKAFAAMILGGLGNIWGTVAGSFILGLVENLSIGLDLGPYSLPAGYKDAFAFIIMLVVLLVKPEGIFSKRRRII